MLVAAAAQMLAAVVGVTLMRLPARAVTQPSPGG
jgi:hypothetical protein